MSIFFVFTVSYMIIPNLKYLILGVKSSHTINSVGTFIQYEISGIFDLPLFGQKPTDFPTVCFLSH